MTAPHDEAQKDPDGRGVLDVVVIGGSQAADDHPYPGVRWRRT
jgi:hypothetical protein